MQKMCSILTLMMVVIGISCSSAPKETTYKPSPSTSKETSYKPSSPSNAPPVAPGFDSPSQGSQVQPPAVAGISSEYSFDNIKFFEGSNTLPVPYKPKFQSSFEKANTRYVWCRVTITNKQYRKRPHSHRVKWDYYNPDGSLRGSMSHNFLVKPEWYTAWCEHGWGFNTYGQWPPGVYKAKVSIDNKPVTEKSFTIYQKSSSQFNFTGLQFFEGPGFLAKSYKPKFQKRFDKNKTRYVWTRINIRNLLYKKRSHSHKVVWRYYNPNGTLRGKLQTNFLVRPEWYSAWCEHGWGADRLGNWPAGTYTVSVSMDDQEVGKNTFYVYQGNAFTPPKFTPPTVSKPQYRFKNIKFFEASASPAKSHKPVYSSRFSQQNTRYIYTRINIENLLYKKNAHTHRVVWRYYYPNGSLKKTLYYNFTVKPEWSTAWTKHGCGGNWPVGKYRVETTFDGKYLGSNTFTIYQDNYKPKYTPPKYTPPKYTPPASSPQYTFKSLQFFEGPRNLSNSSKPYFQSSFPKNSTRYVWTRVNIRNLLYKKRDHTHHVVWRYYNPNGSLRGTLSSNFKVLKKWYTAWSEHGWGSNTPGWPTGTYTVKVLIDGVQVGSSSFTIKWASAVRPAPKPPKPLKFPKPQKLAPIGGSSASWEITNQTAYTLTISYRGPSTGTISVSSGGKRTVYVKGGLYSVNGSCSNVSVRPYFGTVTLEGGWKYSNQFYIRFRK